MVRPHKRQFRQAYCCAVKLNHPVIVGWPVLKSLRLKAEVLVHSGGKYPGDAAVKRELSWGWKVMPTGMAINLFTKEKLNVLTHTKTNELPRNTQSSTV